MIPPVDIGLVDVRPVRADESPDGEGWDLGLFFRCGCILEVEDAFNSLLRTCSDEHRNIWLGLADIVIYVDNAPEEQTS